jgi:ribosomal protein L23
MDGGINVLRYPVATEKAVNMIEKKNIITYVVDLRATKKDIKSAFESMFNVKVSKINVIRTPQNFKKAFITVGKESKASDIALKLKLV